MYGIFRNAFILSAAASVFLLFSCQSAGKTISPKEYEKMAKAELEKIEKNCKSGDVENNIADLFDYIEKSGRKLGDFVTENGEKLTENIIETMKKNGWDKEIEKNILKMAEELKNMDIDKVREHFLKVKKYAEKLGYNLMQTLAKVTDFLSKNINDFSKSEFARKMIELWNE